MAVRATPGQTTVLLLWVGGCVSSSSGFDRLRAADQTLFIRCREPVAENLCASGDENARKLCVAGAADRYGAVLTKKERRRWLMSNGCPEVVVDGSAPRAPDQPVMAKNVEPESKPESPAPAPDPAPPIAETAPAAAPEPEPAARAETAETEPPPKPVAETPVVAGEPPERPDFVSAALPLHAARIVRAEALAKAEGAPRPRLLTGEAREKQLRDTVVAHEPQMKKCVDRQLKLHPALRATGTLVIEVNPRGQITGISVKGGQLAGTPLENCLRDAAHYWVFPTSGSAYAVEAPLRVGGGN